MVEALIRALVAICVVALCVWLTIWVLGAIGIALPSHVVTILWVIAILLVILYVYQAIIKPNWGRFFP